MASVVNNGSSGAAAAVTGVQSNPDISNTESGILRGWQARQAIKEAQLAAQRLAEQIAREAQEAPRRASFPPPLPTVPPRASLVARVKAMAEEKPFDPTRATESELLRGVQAKRMKEEAEAAAQVQEALKKSLEQKLQKAYANKPSPEVVRQTEAQAGLPELCRERRLSSEVAAFHFEQQRHLAELRQRRPSAEDVRAHFAARRATIS